MDQILGVGKTALTGLSAWLDWGTLFSTVGKEYGKYSQKREDIIQIIFIHNAGHLIKYCQAYEERSEEEKQKM